MLKHKNKLLAVLLSALLVSLSGCGSDDNRVWVATSQTGEKHRNLTNVHTGWGWTKFKTKNGGEIVFRGNHYYMEQKAN